MDFLNSDKIYGKMKNSEKIVSSNQKRYPTKVTYWQPSLALNTKDAAIFTGPIYSIGFLVSLLPDTLLLIWLNSSRIYGLLDRALLPVFLVVDGSTSSSRVGSFDESS